MASPLILEPPSLRLVPLQNVEGPGPTRIVSSYVRCVHQSPALRLPASPPTGTLVIVKDVSGSASPRIAIIPTGPGATIDKTDGPYYISSCTGAVVLVCSSTQPDTWDVLHSS